MYAQGRSFLYGQIHFLLDLQGINCPLVSSKHTLGGHMLFCGFGIHEDVIHINDDEFIQLFVKDSIL